MSATGSSCSHGATIPERATGELVPTGPSSAGIVILPTSTLTAATTSASTATASSTAAPTALLRVAVKGVGGALGALLEGTFVGLGEAAGLVAQS